MNRWKTYKIPRLTKTEYATLRWLVDRGYDAGILAAASVEEHEDGGATLGEIEEHRAWDVADCVRQDPGAFLAGSNSVGLNEKLTKFVDEVI